MAPDPRPAWSGTLALNPGAVLYRGPGGEAGRHAHHAVQLVVSLDRPFALELERREVRTTVAMIPSGAEHGLSAEGSELVLTLAEAAAGAHISPSRLTHLFSGEVGIPFRRYKLWVRLRRVAEEVAAGANLTRAAVEAGFSDSAHLSRVFRANFGLPPSALKRMEVSREDWPGAA